MYELYNELWSRNFSSETKGVVARQLCIAASSKNGNIHSFAYPKSFAFYTDKSECQYLMFKVARWDLFQITEEHCFKKNNQPV